jgi:hypothetical protein
MESKAKPLGHSVSHSSTLGPPKRFRQGPCAERLELYRLSTLPNRRARRPKLR